MILTEEKIKATAHITNFEILRDISDTQREIDDMADELHVLQRDRGKNKVRIYFIEGNISQRTDFIEKLKAILAYREGVKK